MEKLFLLRLILHYFDRGIFARNPVHLRPSILFPKLLDLLGVTADRRDSLPPSHDDLDFYKTLGDLEPSSNGKWFRTSLADKTTIALCDPELVSRVLNASPDSFAPSNLQKGGMAQFQPDSLASSPPGEDFERRKRANRAALQFDNRVHSHAATYLNVVNAAAQQIHVVNGSLGWVQLDQVAREVALQVSLARSTGSMADNIRELMERANCVPLLAMLKKALSEQPGATAEEVKEQILKTIRTAGEPLRSRLFDLVEGDPAELKRFGESVHRLNPLGSALLAQLGNKVRKFELPSQVSHWLATIRATLASHTAYTLALLASHQQLQAQLYQKLSALGSVAAFHDAMMRDDPKMPDDLEGAVMETDRLFPAVPIALRAVSEDAKLEGVDLNGVEQLLMHHAANNRQKRFAGNEPNAFDVNRPKQIPAQGGVFPQIFGGGPKECPGRYLGLLLIKALVGQLLLTYEFTSVRNSVAGQTPLLEDNIPFSYDQFGIELSVRRR